MLEKQFFKHNEPGQYIKYIIPQRTFKSLTTSKRGFWGRILNSWLWQPSKHRKSNFDVFKKWRNNIFCSDPKNGVLTDHVLENFLFFVLSDSVNVIGSRNLGTFGTIFFSNLLKKEQTNKQTNKTRSDWLNNSYKQKIIDRKIRSEFWNRSCISIPLLSYCEIRGWMYPSLKK